MTAMKAILCLVLWSAVARTSQPATPMPLLQLGRAAAGSTASISVSTYTDPEVFDNNEPIREWSLQVVGVGSATMYWTVDLEVSNDDATWTSILQHRRTATTPSASLVTGLHKTSRRARLTLTSVGGGYVCATGYGER